MSMPDPRRSPAVGAEPNVGPVLLATPWYRPDVGGVVEAADRLARGLLQAGNETHLLVCSDERSYWRLEPDPHVTNVWRLQIPAYVFDRLGLKRIAATLIRGPLVLWRLYRFIRNRRVRTVLVIYPSGYAWPFLLLRYIAGVRLIIELQGNDITKYDANPQLARWFLRRLLRAADAIAVCADHLGHKAQGLFPDKPLPVRLIPNCVDFTHFVPAPPAFRRADPRPTLVHVSIFLPKKRTLDILEAFAIAAIPPSSRLVMVGAGPDLDAAIQHAQRLGIDDRVQFVGLQKDVRPFLWQADLLVLASDDEGAPHVLVEAMACGLPWISTPWGAAATLPPGECGLVVPPRSPQRLAAAMAELLNDPDRRRAMSFRARQRAETEFGEDVNVARHIQLIHEVEQGPGARVAPVLSSSAGRRGNRGAIHTG